MGKLQNPFQNGHRVREAEENVGLYGLLIKSTGMPCLFMSRINLGVFPNLTTSSHETVASSKGQFTNVQNLPEMQRFVFPSACFVARRQRAN